MVPSLLISKSVMTITNQQTTMDRSFGRCSRALHDVGA